jgi:hypothetical protein
LQRAKELVRFRQRLSPWVRDNEEVIRQFAYIAEKIEQRIKSGK